MWKLPLGESVVSVLSICFGIFVTFSHKHISYLILRRKKGCVWEDVILLSRVQPTTWESFLEVTVVKWLRTWILPLAACTKTPALSLTRTGSYVCEWTLASVRHVCSNPKSILNGWVMSNLPFNISDPRDGRTWKRLVQELNVEWKLAQEEDKESGILSGDRYALYLICSDGLSGWGECFGRQTILEGYQSLQQ